MKTEMRKTSKVKPYTKNPRKNDSAVDAVAKSIETFGFRQPIVVDKGGMIIVGHTRWKAAKKLGLDEVPVHVADLTPAQAKAYRIADNKTNELAEWDFDLLSVEIKELQGLDIDLDTLGFSCDELNGFALSGEGGKSPDENPSVSLAERFGAPPFSVLDARQGYWQERKRAWLALGIQSELGRHDNLASAPAMPEYSNCSLTYIAPGTSIFDPVLCELAYRWFCPPAGKILDPFAGGSVRGIVAAWLGRNYTGVELRPEQVAANEKQWGEIAGGARRNLARWITGDAINTQALAGGEYDFLFSCPPYYDLEVYSDLAGELSAAKTYDDFVVRYRKIIAIGVDMLKADRFACFVVGDIRDKRGIYRNFVSDTISAFRDSGAKLYNDAILVTAIGSLPIRIRRQFEGGRKLGKTHQNVLIFIKGNPRRAAERCGRIDDCVDVGNAK